MEVQRKLTVGRAANALLETKPLRRMAPRVVVARRLHAKAGYCFAHCAPLYAGLLERSAQDVLRGGPCLAVLRGREQDPKGSAMALRFMGSIHRLVLEGRSPALAHFYPSVGGAGGSANDRWGAFSDRRRAYSRVAGARPPSGPDERGWTVFRTARGVPARGQTNGTSHATAGGGRQRRSESPMGLLSIRSR